jgi:hypothetical protein
MEGSDLDLSAAYLPHVHDARAVGFIVTFPYEAAFYNWSVDLDCRCRRPVSSPAQERQQTREQYRQAAATWLNQTPADRIVVIDGPIYEYDFAGLTYERLSAQLGLIENDPRFVQVAVQKVPSLNAVVSVWRRR